jgi:hypothetical protein
MPCQKRSLDEPIVRELLTGLKHGNKRYYHVDSVTGLPIAFHARSELMKLAGLSEATASRLLAEALSTGLITEMIALEEDGEKASANVEVDDSEEDEEDTPKESGPHCRKSPLGLSDVLKSDLRPL